MKNYTKAAARAGVGGTPQLCQDVMVEMLEEMFQGKKFIGQKGRKELKVFKQNLPHSQTAAGQAGGHGRGGGSIHHCGNERGGGSGR